MTKMFIIIVFVLSVFSAFAHADDVRTIFGNLQRGDISKEDVQAIVDDLALIQKSVKTFGIVEAQCSNSYKFKTNIKKKVHSNDNNQDLKLTELTPEEAQRAFDKVKNNKSVPLNLNSSSSAEAHMINILLEKDGIISGKVFIEGRLYQQVNGKEVVWQESSAAIVIVNRIPMVIDPARFDRPVSYAVWEKKILENAKSKLDRMYLTDRYAYGAADRDKTQTQYDLDSLDDLNNRNQNSCKVTASKNNQDPDSICGE